MFWKRRTTLGLRAQLLAVLLPGMLVIICAELWLTRSDAIDAANAAFDRSLSGAIRSVDQNVSTASGGLAVELPYRLFEFFQLTAGGNVYFRVATSDGLVEIGSPDLPLPDEPLEPGVPIFRDAVYFGEPVRVGTYLRVLDQPLRDAAATRLVIQVAEGTSSRREFTSSFVVRSALRDAFVISLVGLVLAVLVTLTLRPVALLARQVQDRDPSDLRPLDAMALPRDIRPLVDAVNHQLERNHAVMDQQRRFIDDASHQLRTPLATLHTQVGYAMRQSDPADVVATLRSIADHLDRATRGANQLLALARSDAALPSRKRFDLNELVREVARDLIPLARSKDLDFGVELPAQPSWAHGDRALLGEALTNLAHNAVVYTDRRGAVTLTARTDADGHELRVVSTGAPVAAPVLDRLGERFVKGEASRGAGLGLAIAKSIVERHAGRLAVERQDEGQANAFSLRWPRSAA
jgi:two-component system sensor histidine kinase TctE